MNIPIIHSHPQMMMEKPVIAGTRITVESILERLGAGETPKQIMAANVVSYITPVPGGVEPMTIAALLQHTLQAAKINQ